MFYLPPLRPLVFVGLLVVLGACVMLPPHTTNARRVVTTATEVRNNHVLTDSSAKHATNGAFSNPQRDYFSHNAKSLLIAYAPPPPSFNGYNYQRTLTIDHNKVPNTDQSNFPVLISGTYSYLATVANGGYVQNANGYDVIFTSDSGCTTKLNHEVETYNATTGGVNYWVKVPTVSHTNDTSIYMCYGNAGITTDQSNKTGVWDGNFKGVWHLPNGTNLSANDSTSNGINGTVTSTAAVSGQIDGGGSFNGSSSKVDMGNAAALDGMTALTISVWIKPSSLTGANRIFTKWLGSFLVGTKQGAGTVLRLAVQKSGVGISIFDSPAATLSTGNWQHCVITWSQPNTATITVNGTARTVTIAQDQNVTSTGLSSSTVQIGYSSDAVGAYFDGLIDEVRMSNVVRSADWSKTEYNNQSSPATFYTISAATSAYPPTVSITSPTSGAIFPAPASITITAAAADQDGTVTKVEFFKNGVKIGEDTSSPFSFAWNNVPAGSYSLTAVATDNANATGTSAPVSIVVNVAPTVSLTSPTNNAVLPALSTVTINATANDSDGTVSKVEFFKDGVEIGEDTSSPFGLAWNNVPAGSYSLTAVATDNVNATATSAAVSILVNAAPSVSITSPTNNAAFTGSSVTINATANDSDDGISRVEFFRNGVEIGEDLSAPYSFAWANAPQGSSTLTAIATDGYGATTISTAVLIHVVDFNLARLDPDNRTGGSGEDPLSRNFNWSVPLVGLPGRAGLNLGLSLSYNSLVWTRSGSYISFNADGGISPGFRIGFPVIQPIYYNQQVGKNAFMLISPDGSRTELRQVGSSQLYEAADSSYLLFDSNTMTLRTTDGTQLSYAWQGSDYQCTKIKDRNGNFITINYASGRIDNVVDTLDRKVKFNYTNNLLTSIKEIWTLNEDEQSHTWATFMYDDLTISTNFTGLTNLGPQNEASIKVLTSVITNDNSRFDFDYTSWGQVWKIRNYAPDGTTLLNYRRYNLPLTSDSAQTDCPRFTERWNWAQNWNRSGPVGQAFLPVGPEQEVLTRFNALSSASWTLPDGTPQTGLVAQITLPDLTYNKIYFPATIGTDPKGWHRGYPSLVETYENGNSTPQRRSVTTWTQDNETVSYPLNPRVIESNIYDPAVNRARTSIEYQSINLADGTSCSLPEEVIEYHANATTVLRRTVTLYNLATTYTNRRIIGLASDKLLYEGTNPVPITKVGFQYDEAGSIEGNDEPVQHDNLSYTSSFVEGRGNLSSIKRYDVTNTSQFTTSRLKYNTAGAVVSTFDALDHRTTISYLDSFSDGQDDRNTLAYPTSVTDADGFSSLAQYNFQFGALTRKQTPPPNPTEPGPIQTLTYDNFGRLERVTSLFNNAYTRYVYGPNYVETFATVNTVADEAHSIKVFDGVGRVIATASNHPGSVGGFSGQLILFDQMGRAIKTSNPTETSVTVGSSPIQPYNWIATGDDYSAGWLYTQQTYDWKGRPRVTTNTDGTTKEASYSGCGCAGGEVVTLTDEGTIDGGVSKRRQQKIYSDVLGRTVKTEILNWEGGSVYSATVNTYNARDQVTVTRQFAGPETSGTYQDTTATYDGHGRLKTKHVPEQSVGTVTSWDYNADDTVQKITDARGSVSNFAYNSRQLVTQIAYDPTSGMADTPDVVLTYDAAGNRTSMTDEAGSLTLVYDQISRLTSESRTFTGVGTFALNYDYNRANKLTGVTGPFGISLSYSYDQTGRLSDLTGAGYLGVTQFASNVQYRAFGAVKATTYGNGKQLSVGYNSRLRISSYNIPGVLQKTYDYHSDGRMDHAFESLDNRYDRRYRFDQTGRVSEATSGAEARGTGAMDGPYKSAISYDVWGNTTQKTGQHWTVATSESAAYVNNRHGGWNYDAEGNMLDDGSYQALQRKYDAAGRLSQITHPAFPNNPKRTDDYDGDGQRVKSGYHQPGCSPEFLCPFEYYYYLRSSVLGGAIIAEIGPNGQRREAYVYTPSGGLVAKHKSPTPNDVSEYVLWEHRDPAQVSLRYTDTTGDWIGGYQFSAELDTVGADMALENPYPLELSDWQPPDEYNPYWLITGNPVSGNCTLDGMPISCSDLNERREVGLVAQEDFSFTEDTASRGRRAFYREIMVYGMGLYRTEVISRGYDGPHYRDLVFYVEPQKSYFRLSGPAFTEEQTNIIFDSFRRIKQKDCTDFINKTLAKYKVDAKFDSVDKLFRQATFGRYEVPGRFGVDTNYTEADLGVGPESLIMLRDEFVNRGATAVTVGTRVFLSDLAFTRSDRPWNRDVADTPSIIVHELFHVAGIDKTIVDSRQLSIEIQAHCRKFGHSNEMIPKH